MRFLKRLGRRFDPDYLSLAAPPALLRLESQPDSESHGALLRPGVLICISCRERPVAPMFRRPWRLQLDAKQAGFIIATSSRRSEACADYLPVLQIDEVKRFGPTFMPLDRSRTSIRLVVSSMTGD